MKFKLNTNVFLFVAVLSLNLFVGCGKNTTVSETDVISDTEVETVEGSDVEKENTKDEKKKISSGDIIFSTKYQIEDSRQGTFIVSKSDGLLYGLLDNQGNEILPVKYDKLEYIGDKYEKTYYKDGNKEAVNFVETNNDKYIGDEFVLSTYEGQQQVFDLSGEEVLSVSKGSDIKYIDNQIKDPEQDVAFFASANNSGHVVFYKKDGSIWKEVTVENWNSNYGTPIDWVIWISNSCFYGENGGNGSDINKNNILYDYDYNVLAEFEEFHDIYVTEENNVIIYELISPDKSKVGSSAVPTIGKYVVDLKGNIIDKSTIPDISFERNANSSHIPNDCKYVLYTSNDTWKLVDDNNNPIYDERYFKKYEIDGENNCFALENEDTQICLFNRNAKLMVDYGILEMRNDNLYLNGESATVYEDKDCIYILVKNSGMTNVYYFDGE